MGSWDANDNFQSREVHDVNTPYDSMGTGNLTCRTNTSNGKQPKCQPIYWKDETEEQVNTHDFVNEEVWDEPQETSTYTHETLTKHVHNHSHTCMLMAHVGATNMMPRKEVSST
jgi:hypothetical protein